MGNLEYSSSAKRVLHYFYGSDFIVYVEGDDDVVFWEYLFEKFSQYKVFVKPLGGKLQLEKYIQSIIAGEIFDTVAMDSDFSNIEETVEHHNIVKTPGYSIENTLVCAKSLREVVRNLGKVSTHDISIQECEGWLESFYSQVSDLVLYDIWNHLDGWGEVVVGDSCIRFSRAGESFLLCENKINKYISELGFELTEDERATISHLMEVSGMGIADLTKGHFLFSAALRFTNEKIREKRKKISISKDSFLGALVLAFKSIFDESHSEYEYYRKKVGGVVAGG